MKRERKNQKARTRMALLQAAQELSEDGAEITVQAAADRARISRATAYRYFSDPAALATEAVLHVRVRETDELLEGLSDIRARVHAVTDYYRAFGRDNEPTFRKFLGRLMEDWSPNGPSRQRGARRIPALEAALEPVRARLPATEFRDLVLMLSACGTGFEQHVALTDICGLSHAEGDRIARRAVDAILDAFGVGAEA